MNRLFHYQLTNYKYTILMKHQRDIVIYLLEPLLCCITITSNCYSNISNTRRLIYFILPQDSPQPNLVPSLISDNFEWILSSSELVLVILLLICSKIVRLRAKILYSLLQLLPYSTKTGCENLCTHDFLSCEQNPSAINRHRSSCTTISGKITESIFISKQIMSSRTFITTTPSHM